LGDCSDDGADFGRFSDSTVGERRIFDALRDGPAARSVELLYRAGLPGVDPRAIVPSVSYRAGLPSVELIHPQRAKPFHRDGWVYEEKYDGWRLVAFKDGHRVRLVSRTGRDHAARFPEIADQVAGLPVPTLILDGEVCRFDGKLVSRFHLLSEPDGHALATPPVFVVFDCLHRGGQDLRSRPLADRRRTLEDVIGGQEFLYVARRLADDGLKAWEQVQERGYEGLVAKDPRAPYDSQRARWVKVNISSMSSVRIRTARLPVG
jgi:bifunctional non-homologous end joining protein LigD